MPFHRTEVEHFIQFPPQFIGGDILLFPDGFQHPEDVLEADVVDQKLANGGNSVFVEAVSPRVAVLPGRKLQYFHWQKPIDSNGESQYPKLGGFERSPRSFALFDGVNSSADLVLHFSGVRTGNRETDLGVDAKPDFPAFPANDDTKNPRPSNRRTDLKAETRHTTNRHPTSRFSFHGVLPST